MALALVPPKPEKTAKAPKVVKDGPYGPRPESKRAAKKKETAEAKAAKAKEKEAIRDPRTHPEPGDRIRPESGYLMDIRGRIERKVVVVSDPDTDPWVHEVSLHLYRKVNRRGTVLRKLGVEVVEAKS